MFAPDLKKEDIKKLSKWASVGFAVSCAERVHELFVIPRGPWDSIIDRNAIEVAIAIAKFASVTTPKEGYKYVAKVAIAAETAAYQSAETSRQFEGWKDLEASKAEIKATLNSGLSAKSAAAAAFAASQGSDNVYKESENAYYYSIRAISAASRASAFNGTVSIKEDDFTEIENYVCTKVNEIKLTLYNNYNWLLANISGNHGPVPIKFWPELTDAIKFIDKDFDNRKNSFNVTTSIAWNKLPELGDYYVLIVSIEEIGIISTSFFDIVDWWYLEKKSLITIKKTKKNSAEDFKNILICKSFRHFEPLLDIMQYLNSDTKNKIIGVGVEFKKLYFNENIELGKTIYFSMLEIQKNINYIFDETNSNYEQILCMNGKIYCFTQNPISNFKSIFCKEYKCMNFSKVKPYAHRIDNDINLLKKAKKAIGSKTWRVREANLFSQPYLIPGSPFEHEGFVQNYCHNEHYLIDWVIIQLEEEKKYQIKLPYLPRQAALTEICRSLSRFTLLYFSGINDKIEKDERDDAILFIRSSEVIVRVIAKKRYLSSQENLLFAYPGEIKAIPINRMNAVKRLCDEIRTVYFQCRHKQIVTEKMIFQKISDFFYAPWYFSLKEITKCYGIISDVSVKFSPTRRIISLNYRDENITKFKEDILDCVIPEPLAFRLGAIPLVSFFCAEKFLSNNTDLNKILVDILRSSDADFYEVEKGELVNHIIATCIVGPCYLPTIMRFYEFISKNDVNPDNTAIKEIVEVVIATLSVLQEKTDIDLTEIEYTSLNIKKDIKKIIRLVTNYIKIYSVKKRGRKISKARKNLQVGRAVDEEVIILINALWESVIDGTDYVNEWGLYLSLSRGPLCGKTFPEKSSFDRFFLSGIKNFKNVHYD